MRPTHACDGLGITSVARSPKNEGDNAFVVSIITSRDGNDSIRLKASPAPFSQQTSPPPLVDVPHSGPHLQPAGQCNPGTATVHAIHSQAPPVQNGDQCVDGWDGWWLGWSDLWRIR